VVGVTTVEVHDAEALLRFFADCFDNRAVAATRMNDRSSRSHAVYSILINRTLVDVSEGGDKVCVLSPVRCCMPRHDSSSGRVTPSSRATRNLLLIHHAHRCARLSWRAASTSWTLLAQSGSSAAA
jgi:hypothetical protein